MDSWESKRHNPLEDGDIAIFQLRETAPGVAFVRVSTAFHDGNHAAAFRLEGVDARDPSHVVELVPLSTLQGHAIHRYTVAMPGASVPIDTIKVRH